MHERTAGKDTCAPENLSPESVRLQQSGLASKISLSLSVLTPACGIIAAGVHELQQRLLLRIINYYLFAITAVAVRGYFRTAGKLRRGDNISLDSPASQLAPGEMGEKLRPGNKEETICVLLRGLWWWWFERWLDSLFSSLSFFFFHLDANGVIGGRSKSDEQIVGGKTARC